MSRSYRKPYWTEGHGGQWRKIAKRQASKRVRRARNVDDGSQFKRVYNSWNICDFKFREPDDSKRIWKVRSK